MAARINSVREDVAEIQSALKAAEASPSRRSVLALHNLLAAKLPVYAERLGLSNDEVQAFGGGVPKKPEEPEG